jgi:hypothetical protein
LTAGTQQTHQIRLDRGEVVRLTAAEAEHLYDELWLLVGAVRGALSAAAKLTEAARGMPTVPLDRRESDLVRRLLAKVRRVESGT